MRNHVDLGGQIAVAKRVFARFGLTAAKLEPAADVHDARKVRASSRVRAETAPNGTRLTADVESHLTADEVRDLLERDRR